MKHVSEQFLQEEPVYMNSDTTRIIDIEPGQDWEVDLFRPEDAEGVVRIFRSVYGEGYPVRTYIDPQLLIEANAARRTISSVARTPRGDVVGHNALFNSAAAYEKEASAAGRVAAFLTFRPRPHAVYLPAAYCDILHSLYENLDDDRDFRLSGDAVPAGIVSDIRPQFFDFAGVARVAVHEPGADFSSRLNVLKKELQDRRIQVTQIWLNLACPWVGEAIEVLISRGYFLGGALPRWFDSDGLLMQKILMKPDWDAINVYTDRAAEILKLVRQDWDRSLTSLSA
jgi:hypothetical protein